MGIGISQAFGQTELDAEACVLSSMIVSASIASSVTGLIDANYFYSSANQEIFSAVEKALEDGKMDVNYLNEGEVYKRVQDKDICNLEYFLRIADYVITPIYPEKQLEVIINSKIKRLLLEKNNEIMKDVDAKSDATDVIEELEDSIQTCKETLKRCKSNTLVDQSSQKAVTELMEKASRNNGVLERGLLETGFLSLDSKSFLEKGEVTIMAGRPGMGKSSVALKIAQSMAILGKKILYIFHESSKEKLIVKALCQVHNKTETEIRSRFVDFISSNQAYHLNSEKFLIVPNVRTLKELKRKVRELKNQRFIPDAIIIDQVTKMSNPDVKSNMRTYEIESITNFLEAIASGEKEDGSEAIAILGLAQINRGKESEDYPYPGLDNLRDSGGYEQSGSTVVLLFRPGYYYDFKKHKKGYTQQIEGLMKKYGCNDKADNLLLMIFAKCRYGSPSEVPMRFNLPGTGITEWERQDGMVI